MHDCVDGIKDDAPENNAQHIDQQIDKGGALAGGVGTQRREQDRYGGADGNAHRDGECHIKGDRAGNGQCLQNTDSSRSALQNTGEYDAHQNTQDRVGEFRQEADKGGAFFQGRHSTAHGGHAEHQNGKTHQNVPHIDGNLLFGGHTKNNTHHGNHTGQSSRGEQLDPAFAAAEIAQTDDPSGNTGAQNSAQNNADGLFDLHHAGVDKTNHHDRGGRR